MTDRLTRQEISDAVGDLGWRYVLSALQTVVPVASMGEAADLAGRVAAAAGTEGVRSLSVDLRGDRVALRLQGTDVAWVSPRELDAARRITEAVRDGGAAPDPQVDGSGPRSVQAVEIAIDALDIAAIRPFWKAVLAYADEPGADGPQDPLVDPLGQAPAIWFQQMDAPRPQRNRFHLDVSVPHDEAPRRLRAALAAGGTLLCDAAAPAFWVLADAEGNEACITTWQGRD